VLFSTRAFEEQTLSGHALDADGKPRLGHADILCKYTAEEARKLQVYEEIPPGFFAATTSAAGEQQSDSEEDVVFDDDAIDDI